MLEELCDCEERHSPSELQEGHPDAATKKRRPYELEELAPTVLLLCTDCKLLSKALALRLMKVMEQRFQGCALSGMLYSIALEPLLCKLRKVPSDFSIPCSMAVLALSAYADDLVVMVNTQQDVNVLIDDLKEFRAFSFVKVNLAKSEAILVGKWVGGQPTLPGGLAWEKGKF